MERAASFDRQCHSWLIPARDVLSRRQVTNKQGFNPSREPREVIDYSLIYVHYVGGLSRRRQLGYCVLFVQIPWHLAASTLESANSRGFRMDTVSVHPDYCD